MIEELITLIEEANTQYRLGTPILTDYEYDNLISQLNSLDQNHELLKKVGLEISPDDRKSKLPIIMASMNKEKTILDVLKWARLKSISLDEDVVLTPKYDGLSLCVDESSKECWTRGDGTFGQKSDQHYELIQNKLEDNGNFLFTFGEVIMPKNVFSDNYSKEFANPRNLVAGLLNSKKVQIGLQDCFYIKYGAVGGNHTLKSEVLEDLNKLQKVKVPFVVSKIKDLTEETMKKLFSEWSAQFEIDGIIIEINNLDKQKEIGRDESSNNPKWALAFKSTDFEQSAETEIIQIDWTISKNGSLKPVARLKPVQLDGVTISNVTCNNARFVKEQSIGSGSTVRIVRSGMVIPKIIEVIKKVTFEMPNIPNIGWDENGVDLITLEETDEQRFKQIVSFFEILEVDNVAEGVLKQLWNAGYKSIKDILEITSNKLSELEGFGKRKSDIVFNSIQSKTKNIPLSKLQHATGLYKGLGSKKLALLEHFKTKPTLEEVMSIDGFAETSAQSYLDSYDKFFNFVKDLPVTILEEVNHDISSNELELFVFVFTGFRDKISEELILSKGGKVSNSISKNTTHLVCKDVNSGSSKLEKAKSLGINLISQEELQKILNP